ncbi:4'-phosphopantetheinyl transferase superfamily protein [Dyella sp. C11]|uniref:4'-phosphopantetheinyl transferase family protein n=1 Tax=Dyella sp. C11 TaxID=2126991 RepID=UPI0013007DE9|nr:4'-phosphopantetheinyl transferase superfamily protein [Dyella sp. C11]
MLTQANSSRFTHRAAAALRACGFIPPTGNEARVIVFDSAPWWPLRHEAASMLSSSETSRAARFRHALDHDTYVIAHAFWRVSLGLALHADPAQIAFSRSPEGQPQLPGTGMSTSLSHSGTMVAIAMARGAAVGVDIEGFPARTNLQDIAGVLCTAGETTAISLLDGEARTRALLELWTRKEALLKAFGVGLRVAPASIQAAVGVPVAAPPDAACKPPCRVHPLTMPVGWLGAVALSEDVAGHTFHHV